jgi:hypothetical protein
VVRELPRDDVVLTVCLAGAKRRWIDGTAAEARAHRCSGPVILVHKSEIGRAEEHQWVTEVL